MKGTSKMHNSIIYLSGPIRGVENYEQAFEDAEKRFQCQDQVVLNPAKILKGTEDRDCLPVCLQLVELADEVVLLAGWKNSLGACTEALYALRQGKRVITSNGQEVYWQGGQFFYG